MSIREATRSLTSWLMLDLPITNALRRALAQLDVDVGDVLLMAWEKVSATTFTGTVALADGALVDLVYEVGEEPPRISWWQERDGADPSHVEFSAVASELRGYAGESRNEREARLDAVAGELACALPSDYRGYMLDHDGYLGWTGSGDFLDLFPIHDLVSRNRFGVPEWEALHPGLVIIGCDGSREMVGFDFRSAMARVVLVDITSSGWGDAVWQADSFTNFLQRMDETGFHFG